MPNQFTNAGFESGSLTGWTATDQGNGVIDVDVDYYGYTPHAGTYFGYIEALAGNKSSATASKLTQAIVLAAGETITGWYGIDWAEAGSTHISATIKIFQGATLIDTPVNFSSSTGPSPDYYHSGWLQFSWTAPSAGTYTLDFRLWYPGNFGYGSVLVLDDISVAAAPAGFPNQFTNPGFESGSITGWTKSGSGTGGASTNLSFTPRTGTYFGYLSENTANGTVSSAGRLTQSIALLAGETITGWYRLKWLDPSPYHFNARVSIYQGATLVATVVDFSTTTGPSSNYFLGSWTQFSWQAPSDGTYTLDFRLWHPGSAPGSGARLGIEDILVLAAPTAYTQTLTGDIYCSPTLSPVYVPETPNLTFATDVYATPILFPVAQHAVSSDVYAIPTLTQAWLPHPTYQMGVDVQFDVLPINLQPKVELVFQVFETYLLGIDVEFDVTLTTAILSIPVTFTVYETYQPAITTSVTVYPTFTDGIGAQGLGGKVVLTNASGGTELVPYVGDSVPPMAEPEVPASIDGLAVSWKLSVSLSGVDISARLTGGVSIDQEENAAAIAIFSLRPAAGSVDPYAWIKAPVTIDYIETDSAGNVIYTIRMFTGIVDTPMYSVMTRVCQFTCTDNLQNVISNMSRETIAALTPLAQWTKYIFSEESSGWDYLQQRLETYPYTLHLNTNSQVTVKDWRAAAISLEFTEGAIIDQSLSVTLANAKDVTNQVTASLGFQQDVYRENILHLSWYEGLWLPGGAGFNSSPKATPQMIVDAVRTADALFVEYPWWEIKPPSQWLTSGLQYVGFLNPGDELDAQGFHALVAKRHKQSVKNEARVTVQSSASIETLGFARDEKSGTISVEYAGSVDTAFFASNEITRYVCTAGPWMTQGKATDSTHGNTREGFFGNAYPNLPVTFQKAGDGKQYFGSSFDLADYDHLLGNGNFYNTLSGAASGHLQPGQHVYDFDSFVVRGNKSERADALAVVMAQSSRTILASHRQNRVGFSTLLTPTLERGATVRVDTTPVKATGVVYQIVHNFDIDNGSALTSVTLALSSAKSVGIRPNVSVTARPEIQVTFNVLPVTAKITGEIGPVKLVGPHGALVNGVVKTPATEFLSSINLQSHYHTGTVNPAWTGHITPADVFFDNREHTFVIDFPNIPIATTENADIVVYGDTVEVNVPQDELILSA